MVSYPSSRDTEASRQRRPSDPAWTTLSPSPRPKLQTPRSGRKSRTAKLPSARASPYMTPERVTFSHGSPSPMELFTPKQYMADKVAHRRKGSATMCSPMLSPGSMGPPTQPRVASSADTPTRARPTGSKPKTRLFPEQNRSRPSTTLAPLALISPPRRVRRPQDPACPTVQLPRVVNQCLSDYTERLSRWTVTNDLLNGRSEELDRSSIWDSLSRAVRNVWPDQRNWIMRHAPSDVDLDWFTRTGRIGFDEDWCIADENIATKDSGLERPGFIRSCSRFSSKGEGSVTYRAFFDVQCRPGRTMPLACSSRHSQRVALILGASWGAGSIRSL